MFLKIGVKFFYFLFLLFFGPYLRICFSLILEREEERGVRGRETLMWENIHWLLPIRLNRGSSLHATWVCALTGNQTCELSVHGTILQPTEPHWSGFSFYFLRWRISWGHKYVLVILNLYYLVHTGKFWEKNVFVKWMLNQLFIWLTHTINIVKVVGKLAFSCW